jgi:hypothetical protein
MSQLASVLAGLDGLTPTELVLVQEVIALKTGTSPPSVTEVKPQKPGLFGRRKGKGSLSPALPMLVGSQPTDISGRPMFDIDPLKWEFLESEEFSELIQAVEACSAPLVHGGGRKLDMLQRVTSVKAAWDTIPNRLKRPFRASETRAKGRRSPPSTTEENDYGEGDRPLAGAFSSLSLSKTGSDRLRSEDRRSSGGSSELEAPHGRSET